MKQEVVLPKNIRQIGEIQQDRKVYLEDYVMTYIRKKEKEEREGCAGILVGNKKEDEQGIYLFLTGVLLLHQELETGECWKKLEEEKNTFFPEQEPWGYFLIGTLEEEKLEEITERLNSVPVIIFHQQEGEETLYWAADKQYQRMKGYFIFYERNPQMQRYIAETSDARSVEEEGGEDRAMISFREKIKSKTQVKGENGRRYLAGSFLVLTILMLGVTIVNGYDKMKSMETLIEQISIEQEQQKGMAAAQTVLFEKGNETGEVQPEEPEMSTMAEMQTGGSEKTQPDSEKAVYSGAGTEERGGTVQETQTVSEKAVPGEKVSGETQLQEAMAQLEDRDAAEENADMPVSVAEQSLAERNYSAENASLTQEEISGKTDEVLAAAERRSQSVYTIKYGDTLADISEKYYGNLGMVEKICERNQIEDANMIVPGQKIVLP